MNIYDLITITPEITSRDLQVRYLKHCFAYRDHVEPCDVVIRFDDGAEKIYAYVPAIDHSHLAYRMDKYVMQIHSDSDDYRFWDDNGHQAIFPSL